MREKSFDEFVHEGEIKTIATLSAAGITLTDSVIMLPCKCCKVAVFAQGSDEDTEKEAAEVYKAIAEAAFLLLSDGELEYLLLRIKSDYEKRYGQGSFVGYVDSLPGSVKQFLR